MNFKVPSIEELASSAHRDLIEKEKKLKDLENDPYNTYPIQIQIDIWNERSHLKRDINTLKEMLIKYKITVREKKLKELGI
jgi:hypothetical protein